MRRSAIVVEEWSGGRGMEVRGGKMGVEEGMAGAWYFHGWLPRAEVEKALVRDGDFLALEEEREGVPLSVVAVRRAQTVLYFRIRLAMDGRMYSEKGQGFDSLQCLLSFYRKEKKALVAGSGAVLRRPVGLLTWEFLPDELCPWEGQGSVELGKGCFGEVRKALLRRPNPLPPGRFPVPVAVKECQSKDPVQRQAFFQESMLHLKASRGCPFVLNMLGVVSLSAPLRSLLEFLPLGDLASWLKKEGKGAGDAELLGLGTDLALALQHLASLGMIHLDVAARNSLLKRGGGGGRGSGAAADGLRLVLGDFGLARQANVYKIQEGDYISKRWSAPETLRAAGAQATAASDVWSWGVVLWELWSSASVPYPDIEDTTALVLRLEEGYRMSPPKHFPELPALRALLLSAWAIQPAHRPTASAILRQLGPIHKALLSKA